MHVNISWASFQWNELSYPQEISQEGQKVLVIILSKTCYLHQWSCAECKTPAPTSYPTPRKVRTINCEKIPSSLLMQMVIVIASLSICIALISGDTGDKHYKATCNENFWNVCGRRDGDNCVNYSRGCEISIGEYDTL